eukprot:6535967-Pyramimonas_sp.AAC.1
MCRRVQVDVPPRANPFPGFASHDGKHAHEDADVVKERVRKLCRCRCSSLVVAGGVASRPWSARAPGEVREAA